MDGCRRELSGTRASRMRKEGEMDLKGRDFLKLLDFTREEITYLVDLAAELKDKKKKGILTNYEKTGFLL